MLREKLNTLSHENCRYKENWRAKELLLKLSEVTEKQCGILQDWQILWYRLNFQFCQHSFTFCKEACSLPILSSRVNFHAYQSLCNILHIFSRFTVSEVFHETLNVLHNRLNSVVFWPDRYSINESLPLPFLRCPWNRVRSCFNYRLFWNNSETFQLRSNYKHNNIIKYLISSTPQGTHLHVKREEGDFKKNEGSGYFDNFLPNNLIWGDRGFDIFELVGMRAAKVMLPALTKGKSRLTTMEMKWTRNLAHLRIHVERITGMLCNKIQ